MEHVTRCSHCSPWCGFQKDPSKAGFSSPGTSGVALADGMVQEEVCPSGCPMQAADGPVWNIQDPRKRTRWFWKESRGFHTRVVLAPDTHFTDSP